jgi:membrane associated rhomboid family serine protease
VIGLLAGLGGNIFGAVIVKPQNFMGTDTIIMGLIGSFISFFVYNCKAIKKISNNDSSLFCFLLIFIFMILFMGISNNTFFRLGGILNGVLIGVVMSRKLDTGENAYEAQPTGLKKYLNAKSICGAIYGVLNIVMIILLFV